ncbi:DUF541 domain-containing protein [Marinomonas agarivorans]|nr:DUF541 domain-containing protein [Marinomonas agarivorans]
MKRIALIGSLLLNVAFMPFSAHAEPELKGSPNELKGFLHPAKKIIVISKDAEEIAFKDVAVMSLVVTTKDDALAQSLAKNNKLRNTITKTLVSKGIVADRIKNAKFSTSPDYGWFGDKPDSYKVNNTVTVRIENEAELEHVAKIIDQYDEVTLQKTEYEHSEKEVYLQKVTEAALNKVLAQQAFYAKKLGIELVVDSFVAQDAYVEQNYAPQHYDRKAKYQNQRIESALALDEAGSTEEPATSFEKLTYRARVTVNFTVKQ